MAKKRSMYNLVIRYYKVIQDIRDKLDEKDCALGDCMCEERSEIRLPSEEGEGVDRRCMKCGGVIWDR